MQNNDSTNNIGEATRSSGLAAEIKHQAVYATHNEQSWNKWVDEIVGKVEALESDLAAKDKIIAELSHLVANPHKNQ